jgi:hypothetical protein
MAPHEALARQLCQTDLKELEYASTAAFFQRQVHDWPEAIEKMCEFKGLTPGSRVVERAGELARQIAR